MRGISRRQFLAGVGLTALAGCRTAADGTAREQELETYMPPPELLKQWMDTWIAEASRQPVGTLHLARFVEPIYYLLKPITWKPNPGQERLGEVTAPLGFVTDLTSIPRVFFNALRPDGEYTYPAIIHDYLYWTQERPRKECDMIMKLGMQDFGVSAATIHAIYTAVRAGGGVSWRSNAERKRAGEKRVLKRFPDDPLVRWADWKVKPDVFE